MCTERGNSWRIREVGKSGEYKRSHIPIFSDSGELFELQLLSCQELLLDEQEYTLKDFRLVWNKDGVKVSKTETSTTTTWLGKSFSYVSSRDNLHTFKYGGYIGAPLEEITIEFTLKLNGKVIQ